MIVLVEKKTIAALERVQRKTAPFCTGRYDRTASVASMLQDLKWDILEKMKINSFVFTVSLPDTIEPLSKPFNSGYKECKANIESSSSYKGAIDGGFTEWTTWSQCSELTLCLQGSRSRTRTCTNPPKANGGDDCVGLAEEKEDCPTDADGCTGKEPRVHKGSRAPV